MNVYPLLNVRTDFSLGESVIAVDDLPQLAQDAGTDTVGVVETMSLSSLIAATNTLAKADLKLLTGVRVRVVLEADKEARACFLKLYPVNEEGVRALYRLLSRGFEEDRFYYVPRVTWDDLANLLSHDCLAISTGDFYSVMSDADHRSALAHLCGKIRFCARFYELVPCSTPYYSQQNMNAIQWAITATALGFEPLVTMPTLWTDHSDRDAFSINAGIAERRPFADYLKPASEYAPMSATDMAQAAIKAAGALTHRYGTNHGPLFAKGLVNQQRLVEVCAYRWSKQDPCLPIIAADSDDELLRLCKEGFRTRFSAPVFAHVPSAQELTSAYLPRLEFELATLKRLGFSQYFLLVSDLVRWAKSQGIYVGPGRGSVGGSLVAYLTGITDVDPIRFELLFERFINPDRLDLPDADLDFMSTRREEVIAYLEQRWGKERVAGIVNYNTMGARSAIRDVGRIFALPQDQMGATKFIGDTHGVSATLAEAHETAFEIQEFARRHPQVWRNACKLEGKMRSYGTHAAGVVVAGCDLTERSVVERRGGSRVINWDKRVSEDQGLIKLDVLGLATLDMFDHAIKLIMKRHTKRIDINAISLDDPKALEIFNEARTAGIFQFEGGSVRRLLKDMAAAKPLTFEDLVALNALNRPGPLDAGMAESYIKRRAGKEAIVYPHPVLEPVLKSTYGVLAYQEQVMQVARVLSGFTPGEADGLRKAMGKKDPVAMAKVRDQFVNGAVSVSGMDQGDADRLFTDIEGFAGYAFNRSHAVEYTLIAFQAAWLKAHYLVEFYCAQMGTTKDDKLTVLVKQAAQDGIRIIPPDINISTHQFEPLNDVIIAAPLNVVMGVSEKGAAAIIKERQSTEPTIIEKTSGRGSKKVTTQTTFGPGRFVSIEDFKARVPAKSVNARGIDNLDRVGAFARIEPGQIASTDPRRQKDQIELMPAIADQGVVADRVVEIDDMLVDALEAIEKDMAQLLPAAVNCFIGKNPKLMIILDAPFNDFEELKAQYSYKTFVAPSLHAAGLNVEDAVWTWLLRRPLAKGESSPPDAEVAQCLPFLQREVAVMKPPVIVLLGPTVIKTFFPDIKRPADNIGHKAFSANLDATVIIGFKPTQIYHDAGKADRLTEIFSEAKSLLEDSAC